MDPYQRQPCSGISGQAACLALLAQCVVAKSAWLPPPPVLAEFTVGLWHSPFSNHTLFVAPPSAPPPLPPARTSPRRAPARHALPPRVAPGGPARAPHTQHLLADSKTPRTPPARHDTTPPVVGFHPLRLRARPPRSAVAPHQLRDPDRSRERICRNVMLLFTFPANNNVIVVQSAYCCSVVTVNRTNTVHALTLVFSTYEHFMIRVNDFTVRRPHRRVVRPK